MVDLLSIEDNWVIQSNNLIEAKFSLTTLEHKIVRLLAACISKTDTEFNKFEFTATSLSKLFGCNPKSVYKQIDVVTDLLMTRYIKIKSKTNAKKWIKYHMIKNCMFENGLLTIRIDEEMEQFYFKLNQYTKYRLKNILDFSGKYSFRFYELLKQYESLHKRKFLLSELKDALDIEHNDYSLYSNFKNRILLPAQKEINNKTDITFELKEIKEGKKVIAIEFEIHTKPQIVNQNVLLESLNNNTNVNKNTGITQRTYSDEFFEKLYETVDASKINSK